MPDELHLETVVSAVEATGEATVDQCRADVNSLLDPVFNQYDTYSMMIVGRIAIRVSWTRRIRGHVKHAIRIFVRIFYSDSFGHLIVEISSGTLRVSFQNSIPKIAGMDSASRN